MIGRNLFIPLLNRPVLANQRSVGQNSQPMATGTDKLVCGIQFVPFSRPILSFIIC